MLCIIQIIRFLIGQEYKDKIMIDKNYKVFIDNLLKKKINNSDNDGCVIVNNNELHY